MADLQTLLQTPRRVITRLRAHCTHQRISSADAAASFCAFGDDRSIRRFASLYLGDEVETRIHSEFHGFHPEAAAHDAMVKHGLVVIGDESASPRLAQSLLRQPRFLALSVDLRETEQAFHSALCRSAKDDVRRARNRGFTVEILRDPAWAEEFHKRYHQPSITKRHGNDGYVMTASEIAERVNRHGAEFVCVSREGRRVIALMGEPGEGDYKLLRMGWLDADPAIVKGGGVGAIFWFSLRRARELGLRIVSLGGTPPVLEDGVMQFKLKWNPRIDPRFTMPWGAYSLLIDPRHERVQRLFERASLVLQSQDGGHFVLSGRPPDAPRLPEPMRNCLSGWYRLTREADESRRGENGVLPDHLRAWCVREPLTNG